MASETIKNLKSVMEERLSPLIDRDYILLEIPDYPNVGDMLIYQGELAFLSRVGHKCLGMSTMRSFATRKPYLRKDTLLIFSGGGYFGDLWKSGHEFQRNMLEWYPDNPMLILPQSACFTSGGAIKDARRRYGNHKNLTICLRDQVSYSFVKKNFPNNAILAPDMAFYADLRNYSVRTTCCDADLVLMRNDKEQVISESLRAILRRKDVHVSDWPPMEGSLSRTEWIMRHLSAYARYCPYAADWFVKNIYRHYLLKQGVHFLSAHRHIYSTRLHGCILSLLLGKCVTAFDNSYGKIRSLYETWLSDCELIALAD